MKKYGTRFLACFVACVIAFNVIAIPKAKAVATEAVVVGFSPAILALYMKSAGLSLTAASSAAGTAAMTEMIGGYAAATGTTASAVSSSIAAGAAISTSGAIILGVAAVALLAGITAWAINEFGLMGEDGTPVTGAVDVSGTVGYATLADGSTWPVYFSDDYTSVPSSVGASSVPIPADTSLSFPNGCRIYYSGSEVKAYLPDNSCCFESSAVVQSCYLGAYKSPSKGYYWAAVHAYSSDGSFLWTGTLSYSDFRIDRVFGLDYTAAPDSVSVSLDADYESAPEILETQQMTIDVGAGEGATEETIYNLVFNGIADGTLTSTYEITDTDTGTDTEPDIGGDTGAETDTEVGLLGRIANGIDALADKILGGIESLFAPDAELMQEISNTFNSKFGFVSTLHQLGTDLLSIDASSAPPVVYIHLEDAEGSIYYGETVKALDMTWYARYKSDVDRIMSGFLWLGFLWLLFKRASAIIQGAEMATDYGVDVHDGYRIRGERNGKRF